MALFWELGTTIKVHRCAVKHLCLSLDNLITGLFDSNQVKRISKNKNIFLEITANIGRQSKNSN